MVGKRWIVRVWFGGALYCQLALVGGTQGQQVLAPLPAISTTPPAVEEVDTNSAGYIDLEARFPAALFNNNRFKWVL